MRRFVFFLTLLFAAVLIAAPTAAQDATPLAESTATPAPIPFVPCVEPTASPDATPTPASPSCAHLTATLSVPGVTADFYIDGALAASQVASLDVQVTAQKSHSIGAKAVTDPAANGIYEWVMSYPAYAYLQPGAEKAVAVTLHKKFLKGFLKIKCTIINLPVDSTDFCQPSVDSAAVEPIPPGATAAYPLVPGKHSVVVTLGPEGAGFAVPAKSTVYIYAGSTWYTFATLRLFADVPPDATVAQVVHIVDGDTIDALINGTKFRIRYIGMNTPETSQVCGSAATYANSVLVNYKTVALAKDVSETDQFGRLLRYVWVGNTFVNAELVKKGYALAADYPPDTKFSALFHALEAQAQAANTGCWPTGVWNPPTPVPPPSGGGGGAPVCDCSGNIYNCSDFPTHAAAQACYDYCLQVTGTDIHRLDADHDGLACENLP